MSVRDQGYVRVWIREDGTNAYAVHRDEWGPLLAAWKGGETFCEVRDIYGDLLVLKLASVVVVGFCSPEGHAIWEADEAEREAELKAKGLTE